MLEQVFEARPFRMRNADEFDLSKVLDLFVDPTQSLHNPFDYENVIVKGRMGTGKTMYLRANYAFYLYNLVPSIMERSFIVLPIYIRLSDFQHITNPEETYKAIIIRIIEEITNVYISLQDAQKMADIHNGVCKLPFSVLKHDKKLHTAYDQLSKLSSQEYRERIQSETEGKVGLFSELVEGSIRASKLVELDVAKKSNPSISDVHKVFSSLLNDNDSKILILFDEAGSVNKSFFSEKDGASYFEILMNQLRTADYIRTKIAVYPGSYSDILTETRYGDTCLLSENIMSEDGYNNFFHKAIVLIEKYVSVAADNEEFAVEDIFENMEPTGNITIEQLINASAGNMRRFVQLLDQTMLCAYEASKGKQKITIDNAIEALTRHGKAMEDLFNSLDKEFLDTIVQACKSRQAYRFKFPNKAPSLYKYTTKSEEANILNVIELGTGRRSTTYEFDYAYCVYKGLSTHFLIGTERIDRQRSRQNGTWIQRVTTLSDDLLEHASSPGKIEGEVTYIKNHKGLITGEDDKDYYCTYEFVIEVDRGKKIIHGKRVRFYPLSIGESLIATDIEILS